MNPPAWNREGFWRTRMAYHRALSRLTRHAAWLYSPGSSRHAHYMDAHVRELEARIPPAVLVGRRRAKLMRFKVDEAERRKRQRHRRAVSRVRYAPSKARLAELA